MWDLGSTSITPTTPFPGAFSVFTATFSGKLQQQMVRGGINYRFGPDQTAQIPLYDWAGAFVGGTAGFDIGRNASMLSGGVAADRFYLSPRDFDIGGIGGYNWQLGRLGCRHRGRCSTRRG